MVQKREGYKFVILEPAKTWIAEDKCAGCGKLKSDWTRSTKWKCCSTKCTEHYMKNSTYYGWPELRRKAIMRDRKCVKCGKVETSMRECDVSSLGHYEQYEIILSKSDPANGRYGQYVELVLLDMSKYIVDHIIPISLNGPEWDINNLQTLCIACNRDKTRIDAGHIANARVKEKIAMAGQKFFDELEI